MGGHKDTQTPFVASNITLFTHRRRFYYNGTGKSGRERDQSLTNLGPNVGGSSRAWFGRGEISHVGKLQALPTLILNMFQTSKAESWPLISGAKSLWERHYCTSSVVASATVLK